MTINGGERLGWTQAGNGADTYVYAAYVDGARNELPQATCMLSEPAVYTCQSPLPPLTKGTHTLQLSAAIHSGASLVEGPKSEAVIVTLTSSGTASIGAVAETSATFAAPPPPAPTASCGLSRSDPTHAIAWTTDGEIALIDLVRRSVQRLTWSREADAGWRVIALASRLEEASYIVYAAFVSSDTDPRLRLTRYRKVNSVLGERAVLAEGGLPSVPERATPSFGPDGRLFIAFAWAPSAVARPFAMSIDPGAPAPFEFDARFTARAPVVATWAADGQFWIVEKSGERYEIRSTDVDKLSLASTSPIIGIEALATTEPGQIAVFASDGSSWVFGATRSERHSVRVLADHGPFDALSASGMSSVGCAVRPQLSFTFGTAVASR